jgi:hypothetical protein
VIVCVYACVLFCSKIFVSKNIYRLKKLHHYSPQRDPTTLMKASSWAAAFSSAFSPAARRSVSGGSGVATSVVEISPEGNGEELAVATDKQTKRYYLNIFNTDQSHIGRGYQRDKKYYAIMADVHFISLGFHSSISLPRKTPAPATDSTPSTTPNVGALGTLLRIMLHQAQTNQLTFRVSPEMIHLLFRD